MAEIQLVETSLRDGNQCLWAALGVDTARTLTIAPVMDQVGFKAIDFTTSTHMGVAVRYKQEDPWERIRLMAEATPNTPLQFLSNGFRFISWETASPEFMALAYRTVVNHGIRRVALADPMNDVAGNLDGARMAKQGGADTVVAALVFTISPIHDDAHYAERARQRAASPDVDAINVKGPGGPPTPTPSCARSGSSPEGVAASGQHNMAIRHSRPPSPERGYSLPPDLGAVRAGRRRRHSLPSPGLLSTSIRALRDCAALRAMAKPSPEPPVARSLASSTR